MTVLEIQTQVYEKILQGDREQANAILDHYADSTSFRTAMTEVMEPVLEKIGVCWDKEDISLAQGYIAGKVAEDLLMKILDADKKSAYPPILKGPVILGNIQDDFHSLGRKLVSIFLQSAGWRVIDMGNDVPAKEFVDTALQTQSRVIGVSAMMYTTAENIRSVRDEIDRRGLSSTIKLAVGGAVFKLRPELAQEVGGDGGVANGFLAPALFADLWKNASQETGV